MSSYLILSGALVIVTLVTVAGYYHWRLFEVEKQRKRVQAEAHDALVKKRKYSLDSIIVILRAMLEGQVTLTEASIRVSVLIGVLDLPQAELEKYVAFSKLAQATSHIPILDEWKALPKADKTRLDKERRVHEEKYHDFLCSAAEHLLSKQDDYRRHLGSLA